MKNDKIQYSVSPTGEKFNVPRKEDYEMEFKRIKNLVDQARKGKKEVVVVMGLAVLLGL